MVQVLGSDFEHRMRFPTVDDDVGDGLTLETVAEVSMSPVYHMRLSRVLAVDVEYTLKHSSGADAGGMRAGFRVSLAGQ